MTEGLTVEPLSRFSDRYLGVPRLQCDVGVPLQHQPHLGHNRWHPNVTPAIEIEPGGEVILEALDVFCGQIHDNNDYAELHNLDTSGCHPLTGPVYVDGAEPGDLLDVEILGVEPLSGVAFSNILPGTPGLLGQMFPQGYRSTCGSARSSTCAASLTRPISMLSSSYSRGSPSGTNSSARRSAEESNRCSRSAGHS